MSATNPPSPSPTEQRILAAIVFTDVAGFSTRVEVEESVTLALLERDFLTMRLFSTMHSGTVIKSTGDGLLLYFTSAVQAVEWALKTQRHFADQMENLPATEVLRHRIGIHLGDIFVGGGDVMGDGVNVAARVQTEARAGGICISQVVYGVVKNKLKLDVQRLETRKLKNINETIQMYHVLLEAPSLKASTPAAPVVVVAPTTEKTSALNPRTIAVALSLVAVGAVGVMLYQANRAHQRELAGSEELSKALGAALQAGTAEPAAVPAPEPPAQTRVDPRPAPATPGAAGEEIDFIKLTTARPPGNATPAEQRALQRAREHIQILDAWKGPALARYTRDRPLLVQPITATPQRVSTVFTDASGQLTFAVGGATRKHQWADLDADVQGAIIVSLLMNSPTPLTRDVMRGAEAFAFLHGLPDMAEKLAR